MDQAIDDKLRTITDTVTKCLEKTVNEKSNAIAKTISDMVEAKLEKIENRDDERYEQILSAVESLDNKSKSIQVSLSTRIVQ